MALRVCPTCHGMKRVRSGAQVYQCPTCGGLGGVPLALGAPDVPAPSVRDGSSRAADYLNRNVVLPRKRT